MIAGLASLGKTVFLTTHYMDEAQHLAGRVAIIANGRIVAEGRPGEIGDRGARATRISFRPANGAAPADLPNAEQWRPGTGGELALETRAPVETLNRLTAWALERSLELDGLRVVQPSLEDIYLELTAPEEEQ